MGAFQVVYDDFSGGQYMGPKATNLPKNAWKGNNVIVNPSGELIPSGTITAGSITAAGNLDIYDHWTLNDWGYVFTLSGSSTVMYRYQHNLGNTFPVTPTPYALTGAITSNVAFSSTTGRFYYSTTSLGATTIYRVSESGSNNSAMTGTLNRVVTYLCNYKLRLIAAGEERLFYTAGWNGADFGSWSNSQYYDFDSPIRAVFPRTDDLLVVCEDGVYSVTGVLGANVNIQLLIPGANISNGMENGDVVNRALYYVDESTFSGSLDGRFHRLLGVSTQAFASFEQGDFGYSTNGFSPNEPGIAFTLKNGRIGVVFKTGWCYFEVIPGTFARSKIFDGTWTTSVNRTRMYRPAKAGPESPNEYFITAVVNPSDRKNITIYRTLSNVPEPTFLDARLSSSVSATCTIKPVGTVELSEYWHNRPFSVKEMYVEYSVNSGGSISAYIEPTGIIDVPEANLAASESGAISETSPPSGGYRMYRYWPNNASKGFGVKPHLTLTNCSVKRVILNCED